MIFKVFICLLFSVTTTAFPGGRVEVPPPSAHGPAKPWSDFVDVSAVLSLLSLHSTKYRHDLDTSTKPKPKPELAEEEATASATHSFSSRAGLKRRTERENTKRRRKEYVPYSTIKLYSGPSGYIQDALYIGRTEVGYNQQMFWTTYDTGSVGFLVPSQRCTINDGCLGSPDTKYNELGHEAGESADLTYRGVTSYVSFLQIRLSLTTWFG